MSEIGINRVAQIVSDLQQANIDLISNGTKLIEEANKRKANIDLISNGTELIEEANKRNNDDPNLWWTLTLAGVNKTFY